MLAKDQGALLWLESAQGISVEKDIALPNIAARPHGKCYDKMGGFLLTKSLSNIKIKYRKHKEGRPA